MISEHPIAVIIFPGSVLVIFIPADFSIISNLSFVHCDMNINYWETFSGMSLILMNSDLYLHE
jgi:hypothetical protein